MKSPNEEFSLDVLGGCGALSNLIDEVLLAGREALSLQRAGVRATEKLDQSPVTEADQAVEARLKQYCLRTFPQIAFLGEESASSGPQASSSAPPRMRFVVDPIDGTRAFMRGLPTWSILVGLEFNDVPVLGIAFMPADDDLFVAVHGSGAFYNGRPLRVSRVRELKKATVSHGSLAQFSQTNTEPLLSALSRETYTQRGFADFDGYRQLLLGRVDAMIDPGIQPWDVCAPAALVREAGGAFSDLRGNQAPLGGSALATNGVLHGSLLELIDHTLAQTSPAHAAVEASPSTG